jgi:hypothetical protein
VKRWVLALLVALYAALSAVLILSKRDETARVAPELTFTPTLNTYFTAHGLRVELHAPIGKRFPAGITATLTLETPAGPIRTTLITTASITVSLELPYHRAGLTPLTVQIGKLTFRDTVRRDASRAISPLELNIGARAVRVGLNRAPAVVLHPVDANDNVSAEPVLIRASRPDGSSF